MGEIFQYSYNYSLEDLISIDVYEIVDGSKKLKEIMNNRPEWLSNHGDEDEQIEYLKEKVIIKIYEKFEFKCNKISGAKFSL